MVLVQPDFAGKVCCLEGEDAREEFQRIFGFPAEYIIASAMRGLRPVHEADHLHSQASAEGSGFYHAFVSGVETEIDMLDQWEANRKVENQMSPRAYRADGLALAFAQGNSATGHSMEKNLRVTIGRVTALELQKLNTGSKQLTFDFLQESTKSSSRLRSMWLIIYNRNKDRVSLEVSLPIVDSIKHTIVGWDERLIFGEITQDMRIAEAEINDESAGTGDVAVAISAK